MHLQSKVVVVSFENSANGGLGAHYCAAADYPFCRAKIAQLREETGVAERSTDDAERLEYLACMIAELRVMAEASCLPTLTYFLEMAQMEAQDNLLRKTGSAAAGDKRDAVA
jgi:hypothetical protein